MMPVQNNSSFRFFDSNPFTMGTSSQNNPLAGHVRHIVNPSSDEALKQYIEIAKRTFTDAISSFNNHASSAPSTRLADCFKHLTFTSELEQEVFSIDLSKITKSEVIAYLKLKREKPKKNAIKQLEKVNDQKTRLKHNLQLFEKFYLIDKQELLEHQNMMEDLNKELHQIDGISDLKFSNFWRLCHVEANIKTSFDKLKEEINDLIDEISFAKLIKSVCIDNQHLKNLLTCPFTKVPLKNALLVRTENRLYSLNAQFLGFNFFEGKLVEKPELILTKEGLDIKLRAIFIRPDFMLIDLVNKIFSMEDLNSIELDKLFLEDAATLDIVENPVTLECGHTLSHETAEKVDKCPYCRNESHSAAINPNPILNMFIKAVQLKNNPPKLEEIKELQTKKEIKEILIEKCQYQLKAIEKALPIVKEIDRIKEASNILEQSLSNNIIDIEIIKGNLEKNDKERDALETKISSFEDIKEVDLLKAYDDALVNDDELYGNGFLEEFNQANIELIQIKEKQRKARQDLFLSKQIREIGESLSLHRTFF